MDREVSQSRHAAIEEADGEGGLCCGSEDQVSDQFDGGAEGGIEGDPMTVRGPGIARVRVCIFFGRVVLFSSFDLSSCRSCIASAFF